MSFRWASLEGLGLEGQARDHAALGGAALCRPLPSRLVLFFPLPPPSFHHSFFVYFFFHSFGCLSDHLFALIFSHSSIHPSSCSFIHSFIQ